MVVGERCCCWVRDAVQGNEVEGDKNARMNNEDE